MDSASSFQPMPDPYEEAKQRADLGRGELPKMSRPPWTEKQVCSLNEYQKSGVFHPFTCGHCRDADPAFPLVDDHLLVATADGWTCPTCDYTQDWAWPFMVEDTWRNMGIQALLNDGPVASKTPAQRGQQVPGGNHDTVRVRGGRGASGEQLPGGNLAGQADHSDGSPGAGTMGS